MKLYSQSPSIHPRSNPASNTASTNSKHQTTMELPVSTTLPSPERKNPVRHDSHSSTQLARPVRAIPLAVLCESTVSVSTSSSCQTPRRRPPTIPRPNVLLLREKCREIHAEEFYRSFNTLP
ncbi:unnamed protein product [Diplocarpon coronariae]